MTLHHRLKKYLTCVWFSEKQDEEAVDFCSVGILADGAFWCFHIEWHEKNAGKKFEENSTTGWTNVTHTTKIYLFDEHSNIIDPKIIFLLKLWI